MSAAPISSHGAPFAELSTRQVALVGSRQASVMAEVLHAGSGRPLIFLSGLVGTNFHWAEVVVRIRHRVECRAVQVPLLELEGDDCGVPGVKEMMARYIREHIGRPAVLVGSSFGGHVALRLAIEDPALVGGLVLAGSSGLAEKPILGAELPSKAREYIEERVAELFYDKSKMSQDDVTRAHAELNDRAKARAMIKLSRSCRRDHLGKLIHRIQAPTLVLWGRNDIVTPPEAAIEFAEHIPDARLVWIEQCGHAPMVEKPDEFSESLLNFCDELDAIDNRRNSAL
ncbi:MAG: alpha/beta hydrolase [Phycisphaeraceae bacterium]|nr:alpha/beta hydrolase [Phycisphaeraceae bacterium]MCW5753926.1 alpha/beta hydrolase [Phycisphaeraceae bacterium]